MNEGVVAGESWSGVGERNFVTLGKDLGFYSEQDGKHWEVLSSPLVCGLELFS